MNPNFDNNQLVIGIGARYCSALGCNRPCNGGFG